MSIVLTETNYVHTMWFVALNQGDWLAALTKEDGKDEWVFSYRHRYYDGDQSKDSFDDGDTKRWYEVRDKDCDKLLIAGEHLSLKAVEIFGGARSVVAVGGYAEKAIAQLSKQPWVHMKTLNKDGNPLAEQNAEGPSTQQ